VQSKSHTYAFAHFSKRVGERIGPDIDPHHLWSAVSYGVDNQPSELVEFVVRMSRCGRRLWRLNLEQGVFFVIYDHTINCPITVLDPNQCGGRFGEPTIKPQGKRTLNLKELS
jgi:hypothetical protein